MCFSSPIMLLLPVFVSFCVVVHLFCCYCPPNVKIFQWKLEIRSAAIEIGTHDFSVSSAVKTAENGYKQSETSTLKPMPLENL